MDVTIHLIDRKTDVRAAAFFPDLAGETFDAQVEARRCRPEFIKVVGDDDGILFFISSDVKGEALSIVELNAMMPPAPTAQDDMARPREGAAISGENGGDFPTTEGNPSAASSTEWEPKLVPAQVRVVQLLSDLQRAPFEPRRRRVAVVISAWDLTRGSGLGPGEWLAQNMPLVDQFLRTNAQFFDHRIYGVSAQGVRLDDDNAVGEAAKLTPSRRIEIVGPEETGHDLTLPLVWLMST